MVNVMFNGVQARAPDVSVSEIRKAEIASAEERRQQRSMCVLRVILVVAIAVATYLFTKYALPKILEMVFEYIPPSLPQDPPKSPPAISKSGYAVYDPERVREITNATAASMSVANYGARVTAAKTASALKVVKDSVSGIAYTVNTPAQTATSIAAWEAASKATAATTSTATTIVMGIATVLSTILFAL